ncbi:hypothetical protein QUB00_26845 [Microcoleus sp. F8_C2]
MAKQCLLAIAKNVKKCFANSIRPRLHPIFSYHTKSAIALAVSVFVSRFLDDRCRKFSSSTAEEPLEEATKGIEVLRSQRLDNGSLMVLF